jgi:DNA polymerase III subunit alpha
MTTTNPKFKQLFNPHQHSDYSLDGASKVDQIVRRNKELGASHAALTDHGNMNGVMELVSACKDHGVKPAPGIELYLESPFKDVLRQRFQRDRDKRLAEGKRAWDVEKRLQEAYVHVTVLFKDEWAYRYFCRLTPAMESRAVVRYGERKPVATWDELAGAAGHVVVGSSCAVGYCNKWALPGREEVRLDLAEQAYLSLREMAGPENFFVEVFPHVMTHEWVKPKRDANWRIVEKGYFKPNECCADAPDGDYQKLPNQFVLRMAAKHGDRAVISLDSHFALEKQKVIQTARISNGQENWVFHENYFIMSTEQAYEKLNKVLGVDAKTIEGWVDNSHAVADQLSGFSMKTARDRWVLDASCGSEVSQLKAIIDRHGRMNWGDGVMIERLQHEIELMRHNGRINLLPYFFMVEDIANFCRSNDILMTVRGSAGGSLLLYVLGVSAVNPLRHDLSFARFITRGRVMANTMPDVDMDISSAGRERVFSYLKEKYGDRFCQISTDAVLKLKSSIKDAERSEYGVVSPETERLSKSLPAEPVNVSSHDFIFGHHDDAGHYVAGLIETNHNLKAYAEANPKVWEIVKELTGIYRQKGVHACGILIADAPVQDYVPIITVNDTKATGFSPKSIKKAGLIKLDCLSLNTLHDVQDALASIKTRGGVTLDPWNLRHDDDVFRAFAEGRTETVFQFDTDTVRPYLKLIKPKDIEGLAAVTSLCRPGCLDAPYGDGRTLADVYVARANGEQVRYLHADLESLLGHTYGICLYQEQSMSVFKKLAGYSDEQAEVVRRGIGEKDKKVLESCMGDLRKGCLSRGWTDEQVNLLIDQIMASANYAFNKSHAISYAYIAYACMYLKEKYRLDWWKSVLSHADKKELVVKFWRFVKPFVKMPNLTKVSSAFEIDGDFLVCPVSVVTGMGEKAYAQLVDKAPYLSLDQFVQAHFGKSEARSAIHSGIAHRLIAAGILDSLFDAADTMTIAKKIGVFEDVKLRVKGKGSRPDAVPEKYVNVTPLGRYMLMKETVGVYSDDIRPMVLPNRSGYLDNGMWFVSLEGTRMPVGGGEQVTALKEASQGGAGPQQPRMVACVAYVVEESTRQYTTRKGEVKYMTKLVLDSGGMFWEEVLWPPYQQSNAPTGYKNLPVLLTYVFDQNRYNITRVNPLLPRSKEPRYDVL